MVSETNEVVESVAAPAEAPEQAQSVLSQKNAVRQFALEALALDGEPTQPLRELVTKEVRKVIRQRLFVGMRAGEVKLKRPMDDSKLKKYCSSLVNNWFKKDSRSN